MCANTFYGTNIINIGNETFFIPITSFKANNVNNDWEAAPNVIHSDAQSGVCQVMSSLSWANGSNTATVYLMVVIPQNMAAGEYEGVINVLND